MLTQQETKQLIDLLAKADPRDEVAGRYEVIVTPTIFSPEDFTPRKKVCIGDVTNVVGELNLEDLEDARAMHMSVSDLWMLGRCICR
jgi:hypothetical protein